MYVPDVVTIAKTEPSIPRCAFTTEPVTPGELLAVQPSVTYRLVFLLTVVVVVSLGPGPATVVVVVPWTFVLLVDVEVVWL